VGPLIPGIVDLAWEACTRAHAAGRDLPVFIVPIVWRLHFVGDVSIGLAWEMGHIERTLELAAGKHLPIGERFAALHGNLLRRQCEVLGLPVPSTPRGGCGGGYFTAQDAIAGTITRELESRGARVEYDLARIMHRARKSARAAVEHPERERDRRLHLELWRLVGFPAALYDTPTLTQEAIAENLKRIRSVFVTRSRGDVLHNLVPIPVGRRVAHVRAPEPLAVHEAFATAGDAGAARANLLQALHARLQGTLDALNVELAPLLERFRHPNPLWTGRVAGAQPQHPPGTGPTRG
jgi:hypothetical protein